MTVDLPRAIDPAGLTPGQLAGDRCVFPNCRRHLTGPKTFLGSTPDGTPLFVCDDHISPDDFPSSEAHP